MDDRGRARGRGRGGGGGRGGERDGERRGGERRDGGGERRGGGNQRGGSDGAGRGRGRGGRGGQNRDGQGGGGYDRQGQNSRGGGHNRGGGRHEGGGQRGRQGGGHQDMQNLSEKMSGIQISEKPIDIGDKKDFKLSEKSGGMAPPDKRSNGSFPGTIGRKVKLDVNHFKLDLPNKPIYQYTIEIMPPWKRPYSKRDSEMYRQIFRKWIAVCEKTKQLKEACFGFNGNNVFYSTKFIEDIPDVCNIEIDGESKTLSFDVKNVRVVNSLQINEEIKRFIHHGRAAFIGNDAGYPRDYINALDVILQQTVRLYNTKFRIVGRSYFPVDGHVLDLGFGKEVWFGTFMSVRPYGNYNRGYLLTLNADVANKPALVDKPLVVGERPYIADVLPKGVNFTKGLDWKQTQTVEDDLKDLKIRYELPDGKKRAYRVNGLKKPPTQLKIPDLKISVQEYFQKEYKVHLRYPNLPCLWVGSKQKTIYIPMEFCSMMAQAMPRGKKLNDMATSKMIRSTAVRPYDRKKKIEEGLRQNSQYFKNDQFAIEFGISLDSKMLQVEGRILPPPDLQYKDTKTCKIDVNSPGSWRQNRLQYKEGKCLKNWIFMDFFGVSIPKYNKLMEAFKKVGSEVGLTIQEEPKYVEMDERSCDNKFSDCAKEKPDLIMIVLPFKNSPIYDHIKNLGDIVHKIPTQCVLENTLFKYDSPNLQSISNIFLKVNSKLGGTNHALHAQSKPDILKRPIMIMGADVSHAAPESKGKKPSLAAVVGSYEPNATNYNTVIRVQDPTSEEIIKDMKEITRELLLQFFKKTNRRKPEKIIMFRDGVSEGQFQQVMEYEISAMINACKSLEQGYEPPISYIVVQKRHHTRFFPAENDRQNVYAKSGNVLAGTVVDQGINHPKEGDFFLVSHEGIQGTSRPTHYHVLWDENELNADKWEELTYFLCHLYSRCTRSVSYPAPTYYAHLAADRARKHHNDMLALRETPERIKEKIEGTDLKGMYFV